MADDASLTIRLDPQIAAQLAERARADGVTPEALAADLVAELVAGDSEPCPLLNMSDEELRTSIEQQRHEIVAGTAKLYQHNEVVAGARAILANARAKP